MSAPLPRPDFKLILNAVNPARAQAVVDELMDVLLIDRKMATEAVQNAPIVLISGMTQPQAMNLRTHLVRLGRLGAQLRLTAEPVGKLKQFRWQALPPAVRRPANLFVCPGCGERFIVQRWQPAPAAQPAPMPAPARPAPAPTPASPSPAPEPAPTPPEPDVPEAAPVAEALPPDEDSDIPEAEPVDMGFAGPDEAPEAAPVSGTDVAALTNFLDSILAEGGEQGASEGEGQPPEAAPVPAKEPARPAPAAQAAPPALPPSSAGPAAPQPKAPPPQPAPTPEPKPQPKPAAPAPAPAAAPKPASAPPAAAKPQPAQPKPQPKPAPATAKPPAPEPAGPRYDVSVAKIRGPKQEKLAELIAARQGISYEDAVKESERTVIFVCKGGTSTEAEDWRKALVGIGIKPRIHKR